MNTIGLQFKTLAFFLLFGGISMSFVGGEDIEELVNSGNPEIGVISLNSACKQKPGKDRSIILYNVENVFQINIENTFCNHDDIFNIQVQLTRNLNDSNSPLVNNEFIPLLSVGENIILNFGLDDYPANFPPGSIVTGAYEIIISGDSPSGPWSQSLLGEYAYSSN